MPGPVSDDLDVDGCVADMSGPFSDPGRYRAGSAEAAGGATVAIFLELISPVVVVSSCAEGAGVSSATGSHFYCGHARVRASRISAIVVDPK